MNIADQAYIKLYPEFKETRRLEVNYSGKFKSLNANVKYDSYKIIFSLSKDWLEFSEDLRIGLIQHLLLKIYKRRNPKKTFELDLYEKFTENLGKYSKVDRSDEELEQSFNRVNKEYFNGNMEKPNLEWGKDSFSKLGHYEYASNLVVISNIFKGETNLLDYVMYHELLHKKHGYKKTKTGRAIHHSAEFRKDEAKYKDEDIEKKLSTFTRKRKVKKIFRFF